MSEFYTVDIDNGDCFHPQWCHAKKGQAHSAECPSRLGLADGDVDAFCAQYVTLEVTESRPPTRFVMSVHIDGSVSRIRQPEPSLVRTIRGVFDGRRASASADLWWARRWLAEHLIKHKKLGTVV